MERPLSFANQISSDTHVRLTVLVQVIERRTAKTNAVGTTYRNFMVTDTRGTKVPIVLFGRNIAFFSNSLLPFKRYYISNALVTLTNPLYRVVEYAFTWSLRQRNLVESYEESISPPLPCTFPYDRFSHLYRYADQTRSVCVKALVVHALPAHEVDGLSTVRDFVIMDDERIPMLLRVRDDILLETDINVHARYRVPALIVAYGLKVTTHHGLSLVTKASGYILHNPPLNEERPLKEWFAANTPAIRSLIDARAYMDTNVLFHPPNENEIITLVDAIATIGIVKTVWTKGRITYLPGQEKLWFEACEKCFCPLDVDVEWNIWCSYCQERTKVVVRGRVTIMLSDGDTIIEATMKSPDTEKLIPYTGNELKMAADKNEPLTSAVETVLERKEIVCFMKFYDKPAGGNIVRRYPILKVYTMAEIETYHATHQNGPQLPSPNEGVLIRTQIPHDVEHIASSNVSIPSDKEAPLLHVNTPTHDGLAQGTNRMLSFHDTTKNTKGTEVATEVGGTTITPPLKHVDFSVLPVTTQTSPAKKLKEKESFV